MNYLGFILVYLYAAIPFSLLIGLFIFKKDLRYEGSKNIGATNLSRVAGKKGFILGFILDLSKGIMSVILAHIFNLPIIICGIIAILGHSYSIFIKFKGGKGISTAFGFVLAYTFWGALFAISIFLITLLITKYVSLSSIISVFAYVVYTYFYESTFTFIFSIFIFLIIVFLHRQNIYRLLNHTEHKIK